MTPRPPRKTWPNGLFLLLSNAQSFVPPIDSVDACDLETAALDANARPTVTGYVEDLRRASQAIVENTRHRGTEQISQPERRMSSLFRTHPYSQRNVSNLFNVHLRITTALRPPSQCPANATPQFCILIARLPTGNSTDKVSRYIEIPRNTSWLDPPACTRCTCTASGHLKCEFLHATCSRPCLLQKTRPIPLMYFFPPDSKWVTPPHDKCRSCQCINGQRKCVNCDQILKIGINTPPSPSSALNKDDSQSRSAIGEYSLVASISPPAKLSPCLLQMNGNSQRLISPGQQSWFNGRCYSCPKRGGPLIGC